MGTRDKREEESASAEDNAPAPARSEEFERQKFTPETAREAARRSAEVRSARAAERRLRGSEAVRSKLALTEQAILNNLARIAAGDDEYAKASEQISAAKLLFERAYGRAQEFKEHADVEAVDYDSMPPEQLRAALLGAGVPEGMLPRV